MVKVRKKKNTEKIILILVFILFPLISGIVLSSQEVSSISEVPCVDGKNRINLEGIMCEKISSTTFGIETVYVAMAWLMVCAPMLVGSFLIVNDMIFPTGELTR